MSAQPVAHLYVMAEGGQEWQGAFLLVATPLGKNWTWLPRQRFENSEALVEHAEDLIASLGVELDILLCTVIGRLPREGEDEGEDEEADQEDDEEHTL
jgi:hypothetical protein